MIRYRLALFFLGMFIGVVVCGQTQAELITSTPSGTVTTDTGYLGVAPTASAALDSFGQVIKVPAVNTTLDSYSFWLKRVEDSPQDNGLVTFRAYVMAWDATNLRATGPILFQSDSQVGPSSATTRTKYTWNTGGIDLCCFGPRQSCTSISASKCMLLGWVGSSNSIFTIPSKRT